MKYLRAIEILLGAVFIFSAVTKALDLHAFAVQVSYYGVVREPTLVPLVANTMVCVEMAFGTALLMGLRLRGLVLLATGGLLVGFTALIAYAWAFKGLKDCGCFGAYIKMGPGVSIGKNVVLLAMVVAGLIPLLKKRETSEGPTRLGPTRVGYALGVLGVVVVAVSAAFGKPAPESPPTKPTSADKPFAAYVIEDEGMTYDLGKDEYLVAMLSATCEHCQAAVAVLNELAEQPDALPIVSLMLGTEEEMEEFRTLTDPHFPLKAIEALQFMSLIGTEPPRFYVIRDGASLAQTDILDPTLEDLQKFLATSSK
ncbi:MAG: hypothetical protein K1Y02_00340 [Candidatus Hydrogenedentes bacterium]|nr:hypothetical protein [Candidatus Hydrogenedentota bacterium]